MTSAGSSALPTPAGSALPTPRGPGGVAGLMSQSASVATLLPPQVEALLNNEPPPPPKVGRTRRRRAAVCRDDLHSTKKQERLDQLQREQLPASYKHNSTSEALVLRCVRHFCNEYTKIFIDHSEPQLCPMNEAGVSKFISSTVRPSNLGYEELYSLPLCVQFVRDFLQYEPLQDPTQMPTHICSPHTIMQWQVADCFEYSLLLLSLLLGAGYDAYGVVGFAPKWVTHNDVSDMDVQTAAQRFSFAGGEVDKEKDAHKGDALSDDKAQDSLNNPLETQSKVPYTFVRKKKTESRYLRGVEEKKQRAIEEAKAQEAIAQQKELDRLLEVWRQNEADDSLHGHRLHCWILVLPTARQVPQAIYIEPASGTVYTAATAPHLAIEWVFNHRNVWVNLQEVRHADHTPGTPSPWSVKDIPLDFSDPSCWGRVLDDVDLDIERYHKAVAAKQAQRDAMEEAELEGAAQQHAAQPSLPRSATPSQPAQLERGESTVPLKAATPAPGPPTPKPLDNIAEDKLAPKSLPTWREGQIDMPPSWVQRLALAPEKYIMRYPNATKTIVYKKAVLNLFATYSRDDGLVSQLIRYQDEARARLLCTTDCFTNRVDKMYQRVHDASLLQDTGRTTTTESFGPGREKGLRELRTVSDASGKVLERTFTFWRSAPMSCLVRRHELVGRKIIDHFEDRYDRLLYRSVCIRESADGPDAKEQHGSNVVKVTEKFARNPDKPADADVAKQSFINGGQRIKQYYHYGADQISATWRVYMRKPGAKATDPSTHQYHNVDPYAPVPSQLQLNQEYEALLVYFKVVEAKIHETNREFAQTLLNREKELAHPSIKRDVWEAARLITKEKQSREFGDEGDEDKDKDLVKDFLQPYLQSLKIAAIPAGARFAVHDARRIRADAVSALKLRIIERANIIVERMEEESRDFVEKKDQLLRKQGSIPFEEEELLSKQINDITFRRNILQQRLRRHEEQSLAKYADLQDTLRADPRLADLYAR